MAFPTDRATLSLQEIYAEANYATVMTFDRFDELLTHVAYELKVPVGKLRVTDRFDRELKPAGGPEWDEGFASLAIDIEHGLKRHKRKHEKHVLWTLDEYLRLINELY
jgi:hypothetical protein